jgi:hypothetical protein
MDVEKDLADAIENFNKAKAATSGPPTVVKRVTKRDPDGRIAEVTETPVTDAATTHAALKAANSVVEMAAEVVKETKAKAAVSAAQLGADVADAVVKTAKQVAEEAAADYVEEALQDFKRQEDEDEFEEDDVEASAEDDLTEEDIQDAYGQDEAGNFRTKAGAEEAFARDLTALVEQKVAPLVRAAQLVAEQQKALKKRVAELDGLTYLYNELGTWKNVRRFFKAMRRKSIKDPDHPFRTDPRLRVFMFPEDGPGRVSTETSAEHKADDNPDVQTDQMQDKWHGYRRRGHHRQAMNDIGVPKFMRQTMYGEKDKDTPKDGTEIQDLSGPGGSGGQDFRAHRAPQADNVLMSEYRPRKAVKRAVRRRGLWSRN